MALPVGKLTILVGAGLLGSILAKEGSGVTVSDFVSGAFKIFWKQIRQDDSSPSVKKPQNDSLMAQVNSLRQELQMLASNRPITIVTASGRGYGGSKYGVIIVVVVLGYGYVWWKGWKLPDLMFATRRGLSDACTSMAKQLETVYSAIAATKRQLSSRMDGTESKLDENMATTAEIHQRVSDIREEVLNIKASEISNIRYAVQSLESKMSSIEGKQDLTTRGVSQLCGYAMSLENGSNEGTHAESSQASLSYFSRPALEPSVSPSLVVASSSSFRPALEPPAVSPSSRQTGSGLFPDILSSDLARSQQVKRPLQNAVSGLGLQDFNGISEVVEASGSREVSNGVHASNDTTNGASSSGLFGLRIGMGASFLTRTRSATSAVVEQSRSRGQQS